MKELKKNHRPSIIVLMETKIDLSSMGSFFNKLGFTASSHVDPVGRSGGIWVLWDPFKATVKALEVNAQVIHAKIQRDNHVDWVLSAVYGKKRSLSPTLSHVQTRKFNARMNKCNLMDLGCSRPQLTWSNGRQGLANTLERLDRVVCNSEWRMAFTEGAVRNLPRTYSDHSPLIVYTQGMDFPNLLARPFRLEAACLTDITFKSIVENS
ncbi:hypothetical protein LOK49_LG09G02886 [Camellia lanceoleosa]|uniref:Uncharacterized protein n=1 Tax=Camellia lanceoleosa TaxID=1840588 RepID=A0ACC0GLS1_9ERIC|nr:hypothetical protein LOK49_LG09G02886 [Camellia lanceoleosa]